MKWAFVFCLGKQTNKQAKKQTNNCLLLAGRVQNRNWADRFFQLTTLSQGTGAYRMWQCGPVPREEATSMVPA
jgi:hypothetical protein